MKRVVIVGAGLFGSIAAALAHRSGFRVTLIDRGEARAGSGPAACLMKPGWFSGIPNKDVEVGMGVLDDLYDVKTLVFSVNGVGRASVDWVDPKTNLTPHHYIKVIKGDVLSVHDNHLVRHGHPMPILEGFDACLLAAGVWTPELHPVPMKALAGAAFTFDKPCPDPFIKVWAPYKQLVGFEREPGKTWVGDGSAILEKNWDRARLEQSMLRCSGAVEHAPLLTPQTGLRPYVEGHKAGYFERRSDRVWISTGGAKNGTIIAAINAKRFVDDITHFL